MFQSIFKLTSHDFTDTGDLFTNENTAYEKNRTIRTNLKLLVACQNNKRSKETLQLLLSGLLNFSDFMRPLTKPFPSIQFDDSKIFPLRH